MHFKRIIKKVLLLRKLLKTILWNWTNDKMNWGNTGYTYKGLTWPKNWIKTRFHTLTSHLKWINNDLFSSQQEQNSARWIKEQEETQNIEPSSVFYDNGVSNTAVRIEGYLFKRSHQKVCLNCSLRVLRPVI